MDGPAQRLRETAGVQRVPSRELELFVVKRFLDEQTCAALIQMIDVKRRPSGIVDDQEGISAEMALRLADALGTSPDLWIGMQAKYDLWRASRKRRKKIARLITA